MARPKQSLAQCWNLSSLITIMFDLGGNYALLSLATACGLYALYCKYSRISVSDVPGPESKTLLLGMSYGFTELTDC